jgi:hypothetical protein
MNPCKQFGNGHIAVGGWKLSPKRKQPGTQDGSCGSVWNQLAITTHWAH